MRTSLFALLACLLLVVGAPALADEEAAPEPTIVEIVEEVEPGKPAAEETAADAVVDVAPEPPIEDVVDEDVARKLLTTIRDSIEGNAVPPAVPMPCAAPAPCCPPKGRPVYCSPCTRKPACAPACPPRSRGYYRSRSYPGPIFDFGAR